VIVFQPVLEVFRSTDFALWPVAEVERYGFMPLSGAVTPAEVGTAVMRIAECNDVESGADGRPPKPADPLGAFVHGLLTLDDLFTAGGLRVTDSDAGVTLLPGCCNGLEESGDWFALLDADGWASFGHDPSPLAERRGDTVRLTVDVERDDSPVIELPAEELRRLLAGAERDLADFLDLAAAWAARQLPRHGRRVTAALARALVLPVPGSAVTPDELSGRSGLRADG
jgi:hypothetical protein